MVVDSESEGGLVETSESEPDQEAGSGEKRKRGKKRGDKPPSWLKELLAAVGKSGGDDDPYKQAVLLHMQGEAKKRTQEEDLKRRRRDEECPEEVAELQVWDGTNLLDDGVQSVNAALRTRLRGPFGDPATWFRGDFLTEKVTPVLGNVVHTRHLLGSDRVNPKAIRLLHSRASIVELKVRCEYHDLTLNCSTYSISRARMPG